MANTITSETKLFIFDTDAGHGCQEAITLEELDRFIHDCETFLTKWEDRSDPEIRKAAEGIKLMQAEAERRQHELFNSMTTDEYSEASVFTCSCGESYPTVNGAKECRKCRKYTHEGFCTMVTDAQNDIAWSFVKGYADGRQ